MLDLISFALLPVAFFCLSMYAWVAGFVFPDDALEPVVLPESVDESSETYPFLPRPGFFSCCPMVAASAVRVGLPQIGGGPCGRVGVNSCEAGASLVVILDATLLTRSECPYFTRATLK